MADIISRGDMATTTGAGPGLVSIATPVTTGGHPSDCAIDRATDAADMPEDPGGLRTPWIVLDEASQSLMRAESIVALLAMDIDASSHHAYAGDVASDLLRAVGARLSEAQQLVLQSHKESWRIARAAEARTEPSELVQSLKQCLLELEDKLAKPTPLDASLVGAAEGCMLVARHALDHACGCLQPSSLRTPAHETAQVSNVAGS